MISEIGNICHVTSTTSGMSIKYHNIGNIGTDTTGSILYRLPQNLDTIYEIHIGIGWYLKPWLIHIVSSG